MKMVSGDFFKLLLQQNINHGKKILFKSLDEHW